MEVRLEKATQGAGEAIQTTYNCVFVEGKEHFAAKVTGFSKGADKYHLVKTSMTEESDEKGHCYVLKNNVFLKELCMADAPLWTRYL